MTDEQLTALLRLKRYETPPPEYFDQLLKDIHHRQRSELLRKSLWQIGWERLQTFFGEHSMGSLSYAGAMAGLMIVGLATIGIMTPGELQTEPGAVAQVASVPSAKRLSLEPGRSSFSLAQTQGPELTVSPVSQNSQTFQRSRLAHAPRYVIDARPASYEPSFNF